VYISTAAKISEVENPTNSVLVVVFGSSYGEPVSFFDSATELPNNERLEFNKRDAYTPIKYIQSPTHGMQRIGLWSSTFPLG
jgi:hypothetical protein